MKALSLTSIVVPEACSPPTQNRDAFSRDVLPATSAAVEVAAASAAKNVTAFNNPTPQPVRPGDCQDVDELRARHRN